jgi:hypothetical protein
MFTGSPFARRVHGLESNPSPDFNFGATRVHEVSLFETSSQPTADPRLNQLTACAPGPERDLALAEYLAACEKIDQFIGRQQEQRTIELKDRRAELWAECRRLEDSQSHAGDDHAMLSSRLNDRIIKLSELKQQRHDARPILATSYPTASEMETLHRYARETDQLVAQAEAEISDLRTHVKSSQQEYHERGQQLGAANQRLREVDAALNALKKS